MDRIQISRNAHLNSVTDIRYLIGTFLKLTFQRSKTEFTWLPENVFLGYDLQFPIVRIFNRCSINVQYSGVFR